jgi:Trk K+ transport system NAD-binding subunit
MGTLTRRTVYYLLILVATTALFTGLYSVGMSVWEGRPRSWYRALEVVIQTFTTTGFGEDAPWQSPQMNLLVILMQFAGIGLILSAVDVFVVPWLRAALRPTAPTSIEEMTDHVIVCGYTPRVEVFVDEMKAREQNYVLVEPDGERAATLHDQGYRVLHGDPTDTEALVRAHLSSARALVADVADDENASIALAAREADPDARIITLVEDASLGRYHQAAGADVALSPRRLLGRSLASKVPLAAAANVEDAVTEGGALDVVEVVVSRRSALHGDTLGESGIEAQFDVRVVGAWIDGSFTTPIPADQPLREGIRLFVAGPPAHIGDLREAWSPYVRSFTSQSILLAGYGDSGHAAEVSLRTVQADVTILDAHDRDGVDVVGDVRSPDALRAAGIEDASALIVAVDDDTVATFAVLIAHDLNPDLQILVRAQQPEAVRNLYRAGADFVEALPAVSGRMLAATVFEDEDRSLQDRPINVVRLPATGAAGHTRPAIDPDTRTNYTILAVVRDGDFLAETDADFTFEPDDEVIVAGTADGLQQIRDRLSGEDGEHTDTEPAR